MNMQTVPPVARFRISLDRQSPHIVELSVEDLQQGEKATLAIASPESVPLLFKSIEIV
jgi:hypothetical protein